MQEQKISIPVAIVLAGILIAGAVFLSKNAPEKTIPVNQDTLSKTSSIPVEPISKSDHILGNPNAPVVLVEYSDLECPFCKNFHKTMNKIMETYGKDGKVAWVYRHFPLDSIHPKARTEAVATECAEELGGKSKFWQFTDKIYAITPSNNGLDLSLLPVIAKEIGLDEGAFKTCLVSQKFDEKIENDFQSGKKIGVTGTPESVLILKSPITESKKTDILTQFLNIDPSLVSISDDMTKVMVSGALPYEVVKQVIDTILK